MQTKFTLIACLLGCALWPVSAFAADPPYDAKRIYERDEMEMIPLQILRIAPKIERECVSGFVEVGYEVKKDGKVRRVKVLSSGPTKKNDRAVVRAAKKSIWKPGVIEGKPVATKGHKVRVIIDCENRKVRHEEL